MFLKGISSVKEKLTKNEHEELKNFLDDYIGEILNKNFDRVFMFSISARWCVPNFCDLIEQHSGLYAMDNSVMRQYFNILCYKVIYKEYSIVWNIILFIFIFQNKNFNKIVLASLSRLLESENEEIKAYIMDFISVDLVPSIKNILNHGNIELMKSCLRLVITVQEIQAPEPAFDEIFDKQIQLFILDGNEQVRALAAKYLTLTNDKKSLLTLLLRIFTKYDVS